MYKKKFELKQIKKIYYKDIFDNQKNLYEEINNYYKYPYTFIKSNLTLKIAFIIIYIFQFTNVSANFITMVYVCLGIVAGFFLSLKNDFFILTGTIIFFFKNAFDWSDGFYARYIKKKTTYLGAILDHWGADVGLISFYSGLGIYLYNVNEDIIYLILLLIILLLKLFDLRNYSYQIISKFIINKRDKQILKKLRYKHNNNNKNSFINMSINFIKLFFEDRSRFNDPILLMIILEVTVLDINFTKYIFILIFFKIFMTTFGGIYLVIFRRCC